MRNHYRQKVSCPDKSRYVRNPVANPPEVVTLSNKFLKTFCAAWLGLAYIGCGTTEQTGDEDLT